MGVVMTRRFKDEGGNEMLLRLRTGKRHGYAVTVKHVGADGAGRGSGMLATAKEEAAAMAKLDQLAEDAEKRGWKEALGRTGLTEIPEPSDRPLKTSGPREVRGGLRSGRRRRAS